MDYDVLSGVEPTDEEEVHNFDDDNSDEIKNVEVEEKLVIDTAVPVINPNIGELVEEEEEIEEFIEEHQVDEEIQDALDELVNEFNMEVQPEREEEEPADNNNNNNNSRIY